MKLATWNVNGIRSVLNKGALQEYVYKNDINRNKFLRFALPKLAFFCILDEYKNGVLLCN